MKKSSMNLINPDAAGIDIGSSFHFVCVPEGRDEQCVRRFESFTRDLQALAQWLKQCKVKTVAMESTGIYWLQLYLILESQGFEVLLVNAHHIKKCIRKEKRCFGLPVDSAASHLWSSAFQLSTRRVNKRFKRLHAA